MNNIKLNVVGTEVEFRPRYDANLYPTNDELRVLAYEDGPERNVRRAKQALAAAQSADSIVLQQVAPENLKVNGKIYDYGIRITINRNGRFWAQAEHYDELLTESARQKIEASIADDVEALIDDGIVSKVAVLSTLEQIDERDKRIYEFVAALQKASDALSKHVTDLREQGYEF